MNIISKQLRLIAKKAIVADVADIRNQQNKLLVNIGEVNKLLGQYFDAVFDDSKKVAYFIAVAACDRTNALMLYGDIFDGIFPPIWKKMETINKMMEGFKKDAISSFDTATELIEKKFENFAVDRGEDGDYFKNQNAQTAIEKTMLKQKGSLYKYCKDILNDLADDLKKLVKKHFVLVDFNERLTNQEFYGNGKEKAKDEEESLIQQLQNA